MTDGHFGATVWAPRVISEQDKNPGRVGAVLRRCSLTAGSAKILRAVFDAKTRLEFRLGGWNREEKRRHGSTSDSGQNGFNALTQGIKQTFVALYLTVFSLSSDNLLTSPMSVCSFFTERGARVDSIFSLVHKEEPSRSRNLSNSRR